MFKNGFSHQDLQLLIKNHENLGGVHAYYNEKNKEFGFLYPEITGYFISSLRFLAMHERKEIILAQNSSTWLISLLEKYGGIVQSIDDKKQKLVYSFDTAICANGLLDCYELTHEKKIP